MDNEKEAINFRLSDGSAVKLEYHHSLPSTTELAREYAKAGYPDRFVVFTERQTTSPITKTKLASGAEENGIFISVILRPSVFPSQAALLSHLCAVALVTALDEHTDSTPKISWVSDIYSDGLRIGGAAIEGKLTDYSSFEYIIVSFAVKINPKRFSARMTDIIRKVFESENISIGMIIAKSILEKFFSVYAKIRTPEKYMNVYRERFLLFDKKIKCIVGGKKITSRVVDIDKTNGALIVDVGGERKTITSPSGVLIPKKIKA